MSFSDIALNIWTEIFDLLENIDITNLLRVAKFFRTIPIKNYQLTIFNGFFYDDIDYNSIRFLRATSLKILMIKEYASLEKIIKLPPNIKELITLQNVNNIDNESLNPLANVFPNNIWTNTSIEKLELRNFWIIIDWPKNLTVLTMINYEGIYKKLKFPDTLKELTIEIDYKELKNLTLSENLEKLDLRVKISNYNVNLNKCPLLPEKLKSLTISNCTLLDKLPDSLKELNLIGIFNIKSFNQVEKLSLKSTIFTYPDFNNVDLPFNNSLIKELEIDININFNFNSILKNFKLNKLILNIINSHFLSPLFVYYISKFELKSLKLNLINKEKDFFTCNLALITLEELYLSGNKYILNKANMSNLPNLNKLVLETDFVGEIYIPETVKIFINNHRKIYIKDIPNYYSTN